MHQKLLLLLMAMSATMAARQSYHNMEHCEPIEIPMCMNMPYNMTDFPNHLGHKTQEEAREQIANYHPLIKIRCSADIQLFLCSMYAPVCTILDKPLKPCRDLCESARDGCVNLMKSFTYDWPADFDCSQFPEYGGSEICMRREDSNGGGSPLPNNIDLNRFEVQNPISRIPDKYEKLLDFICPLQFKASKQLGYKLRVGSVTVEDCGAPCYGMFFDKEEIDSSKSWIGSGAIIALIVCLIPVCSYFIDRKRFPYPQMAIIHMSICYLIIIILYIIGFISGDSVACGQPLETDERNLEPERLIRQGTIEDWRCSVIGMSLYFFNIAAALWWVMLTVAWFLNAGLKWAPEAIESSYMHAFVWTVSAILTVLVIVLKKIEGDILSGVCSVGLWDSDALLWFVIVPSILSHGIGFLFLILGISSSIKVRHEQTKAGATKTLDILLIRFAGFAFLYLIPVITEIAIDVYIWLHMDNWMTYWQESTCRNTTLKEKWQITCRYPDSQIEVFQDKPNFVLFMVKFGAIFFKAAFSGTWVWVPKTYVSWKGFTRMRLSGREPAIYDAPDRAHL